MAEPDMEEKETVVANATSTCDKRHCKEMRKEKLPPYLRDRGMKCLNIRKKKSQKDNFFIYCVLVYYDCLNFMLSAIIF